MFIKEADYWEKGLALVTEVLETMLSVQRQYFYAEVRKWIVICGEDRVEGRYLLCSI